MKGSECVNHYNIQINHHYSLLSVVLSSLESITSVLSKREVLSRPLIGTLADRNMNMNIGLGISLI